MIEQPGARRRAGPCADQRWYGLRVTPYRTLDHSIRGALIVLTAADDGAKSGAGATVKGKAKGKAGEKA